MNLAQPLVERQDVVCNLPIGSWRVMEKVGMHYEGRLRENFPSEDGTWRDSLLYAIIDHEWRAKQSTTL